MGFEVNIAKDNVNGILAFWQAYILARPMGASFGDLLSQSPADGGIGLGTMVTSFMFLACIASLITFATWGAGLALLRPQARWATASPTRFIRTRGAVHMTLASD